MATFNGTSGDDTLLGSGGDDSIFGGTGNDLIFGMGGSDIIDGGDGNDHVSTLGEGNDIIYGGNGHDRIFSGGGRDAIYGGDGYDELTSDGGDKVIDGGGGNDRIFSGAGDDFIYGGMGDDHIVGGDGDDIIDGGEGDDYIELRSGMDTIERGPRYGSDIVEGGLGFDIVEVLIHDQRIVGNVSIYEGLLSFAGGLNQISGVELLRIVTSTDFYLGVWSSDVVVNVSQSNIATIDVSTGRGNDQISGGLFSQNMLAGGDGDDQITGGSKSDSIRGGRGTNVVRGGDGDDWLYYEGGLDTINGGEGKDTLSFGGLNYFGGKKSDWKVERLSSGGDESRFLATRVDGSSTSGEKVEFSGVEWLQFSDGVIPIYVTVDTKELRVQLQTGNWKPQEGDIFVTDGNATIGLTSQVSNVLKVVGGTYVLSEDRLTVNGGTVSTIVGGQEISLFSGSFELSLTDPQGAINATAQSFELAGLATELTAMHLVPDGVRLITSFDVPDLLLTSFGIQDEVVIIDRDGPRFGTGGTLDLAKYLPSGDPLDLLGKIGVTSEKLELGYSAFDDRLYLKGDVKLLNYPEWEGDQVRGSVTKPLLSLSDAEIGIKDGQAYGKGEITSRDFSFAGGWALRDLKFNFDSEKDEYSGSGSLSLPFMRAAGLDSLRGSLLFKANPDFRLDGFFIEGTLISPGVPIGTTGVFLRSLGGGASNWWNETEPIKWKGSVGLDWMRSVMKLRFETETDFKNSVSGNVKGGILIDDLGIFGSAANPLGAVKFEGSGSLDWSKQEAKLSGAIDILNAIKGTGSIEASGLGQALITARGTATFKAPVVNLGVNGNFTLKYSADGNSENDYAAAWAVVDNPLYKFGPSTQPKLTVGIRVDIDGDFGLDDIHTFGASEVPIYSSWIVDEGVGDLTVFVGWEQEAQGPVQTRVVVYDDLAKTQVREIIAETDYAANGIAVIDAWSGPTGKVVYIAAPAPGLWDVELVNSAGLGEVTYSATTSLAENSVSVGAAQATGATIRVDYSVTDLGKGGNLVFFADTDNVGFDGTPIGEMIATQASGQFQWDSAGFTPGQYWLYALFEDGARVPLFDYADNAVSVTARTLGSEDDDHLIGTPGIDTLRGLGGNDILEGRYGDDTLLGGSGNDLLLGGLGADTHIGGSGADEIGGSLEDLDGDRITDYGLGDAIRVDGVRLDSWTYAATSGAVRLGPETGVNAQLRLPVGLSLAKFRLEASAAGSEAPWTRLVYGEDADGDGIEDSADNALGVANPDQRDTDGDGYGNVVDADLNQDLMVDLIDLSLFEEAFGTESADADFNGDGAVDLFDLSMLDALFGQAPGPSALHPVETLSASEAYMDPLWTASVQGVGAEEALL